MRLIDIIRISARMIRVNWLRSTLTILGIGVAISLIISLVGLGFGLQDIVIGRITASKSLLSLDVTASNDDASAPRVLDLANLQKITQAPGVIKAVPIQNLAGRLSLAGNLAEVSLIASTPDYFELDGISLIRGEFFAADSRQIVISRRLVTLLDLTPESVLGQTIKLSYDLPDRPTESATLEGLTVVGISADLGDSPVAYLPVSLMGEASQLTYQSVKVLAEDRASIEPLQASLIASGYKVQSLIKQLDEARRIFGYVTIGLATLGFIALMVASIGMFNTLTIALIERTREIGIMKAIGVTNRAVRQLFLTEASILGFFGGMTGITLSLAFNWMLEFAFNQAARLNAAAALPIFQYPPLLLAAALIFPIALAIATGIYPANRAAKLNPLNALRYE